jgi:hypothetical protein
MTITITRPTFKAVAFDTRINVAGRDWSLRVTAHVDPENTDKPVVIWLDHNDAEGHVTKSWLLPSIFWQAVGADLACHGPAFIAYQDALAAR